MPKSDKFTLRTVLLCDDVRMESSGKQLLIGVYNDVIIVKGFPTALPRLSMRVAGFANTDRAEQFNFSLRVGKRTFVKGSGLITTFLKGEPATFTLNMGPFVMEKEARYDILFGVDAPPKKVWDFWVRLARDEKELARFPAEIVT